jgi:hypothetical protein
MYWFSSQHSPGGIGTIGGVRQSPKFLKGSIEELKSHLEDKNAPFGVDLLLPQVGGSARKTNKDYTGGQLFVASLLQLILPLTPVSQIRSY